MAGLLRWLRRWLLRGALLLAVLITAWIGLYSAVNPPGGIYMWQEYRRLGAVSHEWVSMRRIAPVMARSAVAAEDANFCTHWGFDMAAIRTAIDAGGARGASTISQQTVKNVFLWHGRDWTRKALEAAITPVMETFWPKRRVLEVYLNIAEFDTGVFGVQAAAQHYFNTDAAQLTAMQAALLAAALPAPQSRNPAAPGDFLRRRAASIIDGAATIQADGRADCFSG
nr:monofunctional biosynthetic peptidoglycan transglycosylase [Roseicitreum antarcticum]